MTGSWANLPGRFPVSSVSRDTHVLAFPGTLQLNHIVAVRHAVVADGGIGDFPSYVVEDQLAAGPLVPLLASYVRHRRSIYALYAASRSLTG